MDEQTKKAIANAIDQPLEGLLYDLDLLPEQCKNLMSSLRSDVISYQYEEIERLRKVLDKIANKEYRQGSYQERMPFASDIAKQALKGEQMGKSKDMRSVSERRHNYFKMRKLRSEGMGLKEIAEKFGYSMSMTSRICRYEIEAS